jgi:hypothetical protein
LAEAAAYPPGDKPEAEFLGMPISTKLGDPGVYPAEVFLIVILNKVT